MSNENTFDNWLSQQLRDGEDYIEDGGFTELVMASLPAQPFVQPATTSRWPTILGALLSTIFVMWFFPVGYIVESVFFANISLFTLAAAGVAFSVVASAAALVANQRV